MLDLLRAVDPAERVDAGPGVGVALDLGAGREGRVVASQGGEVGDPTVERRIRREPVDRTGGLTGDQRLVRILGHLAGEQRLARVLVAARAHETLLVAVVDHRLAAGQEHELVGEHVAGQRIIGALQEVPDPAHVVVAEEGRQRGGVGVGSRVEVVGGEQLAEPLRGVAGGEAGRLGLESEVEHRVEVGLAHIRGRLRGIRLVDLTEHEEVGLAGGVRVVEHLRRPRVPELQVDVLDRVDAEAVDAEVNPVRVHVDEAVHDGRVLGHQVVEAGEVAVEVALPLEG